MTQEQLLDCTFHFTWMYTDIFFLESTEHGNFLWSSPNYGGDNTIRPYPGMYDQYGHEHHHTIGRDKGIHTIRDYCGVAVKLVGKS